MRKPKKHQTWLSTFYENYVNCGFLFWPSHFLKVNVSQKASFFLHIISHSLVHSYVTTTIKCQSILKED